MKKKKIFSITNIVIGIFALIIIIWVLNGIGESNKIKDSSFDIGNLGSSKVLTYDSKNNEICKSNGKPIVRLFSTTWCPHCQWIDETYERVVQEYVPDLYLLRKRKINLRIYMMVTCQHKQIRVYIHRDGKCIYTNRDFEEGTDDPEQHLTSLNVGVEVYNNRPQSFEQLREWLGKEEKRQDNCDSFSAGGDCKRSIHSA